MEQQSSNGSGNGRAAGTPSNRVAAADVSTRRRTDAHGGVLVLIGGACDPAGEALGRFVELAKGREGGRIVGLTTASMNPVRSARE